MHTHTYTHISKHMHSGVSVADFLHIDILATDSGTSFHPVPLQATDSERGRDNQSEPLKWRAKSIRYKFFKRQHYGQQDIEPFPIHPPPPSVSTEPDLPAGHQEGNYHELFQQSRGEEAAATGGNGFKCCGFLEFPHEIGLLVEVGLQGCWFFFSSFWTRI